MPIKLFKNSKWKLSSARISEKPTVVLDIWYGLYLESLLSSYLYIAVH